MTTHDPATRRNGDHYGQCSGPTRQLMYAWLLGVHPRFTRAQFDALPLATLTARSATAKATALSVTPKQLGSDTMTIPATDRYVQFTVTIDVDDSDDRSIEDLRQAVQGAVEARWDSEVEVSSVGALCPGCGRYHPEPDPECTRPRLPEL